MVEKYGFFARMKDSITKPSSIAHYVVNSKGGKSGGYLFLLSLLAAFLFVVSTLIQGYMLGGIKSFTDEIPNFVLQDGRLQMDIAEPFIVEDKDLVIFDPSSSYDTLHNYDAFAGQVVYINQEGVYVRQGFQENTFLWSDIPLNASKESFTTLLLTWLWVAILLVGFFVAVGGYLGGLVFALFVAIAGLIVNAIFKTALTFGQVFSLSIYAMTAGKVIDMALSFYNTFLPFGAIHLLTRFNYLLTIVFLVLYVRELSKQKKLQELAEPVFVEGSNGNGQQ